MTGFPGTEGATAPVSVVQNREDNPTPVAERRVLTPLQAALELLATPEARAFSRREPRALLSYERAILLDDIIRAGNDKAAVSGALRAAKAAGSSCPAASWNAVRNSSGGHSGTSSANSSSCPRQTVKRRSA